MAQIEYIRNLIIEALKHEDNIFRNKRSGLLIVFKCYDWNIRGDKSKTRENRGDRFNDRCRH